MYVWIWRTLPGGLVAKLIGSLLLAAAVIVVLFTVVFPYVEPRLPFGDVTVERTAPAAPTASTVG